MNTSIGTWQRAPEQPRVPLYTMGEAADMLDVSVERLRRLLRPYGIKPVVRRTGRNRYKLEDFKSALEQYMQS